MTEMNRNQLITEMARKSGVSRKTAEAVINATVVTITRSLRKGETVRLVGFGTFIVRRRSAKKGRNPQTGAPVRIPSRRVPVFIPEKELRARIRRVP